jgi:tetratricopeptide (TPR) repeat protein
MKKAFFIFFGAALFVSACQTGSAPDSQKPDTSLEEKLLQQAFLRKDYATAIVSINTIMARDTARTDLYDTLFILYSELQNPYAVVDVGQHLLKKTPDDLVVLETMSQAYELTGDLAPAAELYKRLFSITGDPRIKLALAGNYFNQGNIEATEAELRWVIDNRQASDTIRIEQPMVSVGNDKTQKIKLPAMAHFMMAQMYAQTGQKQKAISSLNQALKVEPYYDLAASLLLELQYGKK